MSRRLGAGFEGIEREHPLAVGVRLGGLFLSGEFDGHLGAGFAPTPYGDRGLALKNGMV